MNTTIFGAADNRFDDLREAFAAAFAGRPTMGAALSVYWNGTPVVDLWGGVADSQTGSAWQRDTASVVFSCTKGLMSVLIARLVESGELDYESRVSKVWPEFARHGKDALTVGDVLAHRAGLSAPREDLGLADVLDWQRMTRLLADEEPLWTPGSAHAYHAITHGWLTGEIVRRVTGQGPGEAMRTMLSEPTGGEVRLGVPEREQTGIARLTVDDSLHAWADSMRAQDDATAPSWPNRAMTLGHAFPVELAGDDEAFQRADVRAAGLPGAGAVATARGLAAAWSTTIADTDTTRAIDQAVMTDALISRSAGAPYFWVPGPWPRWGAGFQLDSDARHYVTADGFGHDGAGGQVAFAEPTLGLSFAFVTNHLEAGDDHRATTIVDALRGCLGT